mmetsp:Transcript_42874/g.89556  ORF Transcript_42874/g.89556 Transcript_42874/m.89556 type:complete len:202 (+) Transcript_42874:631-1236(+)
MCARLIGLRLLLRLAPWAREPLDEGADGVGDLAPECRDEVVLLLTRCSRLCNGDGVHRHLHLAGVANLQHNANLFDLGGGGHLRRQIDVVPPCVRFVRSEHADQGYNLPVLADLKVELDLGEGLQLVVAFALARVGQVRVLWLHCVALVRSFGRCRDSHRARRRRRRVRRPRRLPSPILQRRRRRCHVLKSVPGGPTGTAT